MRRILASAFVAVATSAAALTVADGRARGAGGWLPAELRRGHDRRPAAGRAGPDADGARQRLAGAGVTFTNAYATFPLCCPSRATFLTGQYAHNHGVMDNEWAGGGGYRAFDNTGSLPVALQGAGYRTGLIGKYMNEYEGPEIPEGWSHWAVRTRGQTLFGYRLNVDGKRVEYGSSPCEYQTDVIARRGARFIRQSSGARPFFLWTSFFAPHGESIPGDERWNPRPAPRHRGRYRRAPSPRPRLQRARRRRQAVVRRPVAATRPGRGEGPDLAPPLAPGGAALGRRRGSRIPPHAAPDGGAGGDGGGVRLGQRLPDGRAPVPAQGAALRGGDPGPADHVRPGAPGGRHLRRNRRQHRPGADDSRRGGRGPAYASRTAGRCSASCPTPSPSGTSCSRPQRPRRFAPRAGCTPNTGPSTGSSGSSTTCTRIRTSCARSTAVAGVADVSGRARRAPRRAARLRGPLLQVSHARNLAR